MKANIYIDGGNLYFGLLKGHPEMKWLDLDAFCRRLVGTDHELNAIKYFTANIKTYPHDPASVERQNLYLQAVAAKGGYLQAAASRSHKVRSSSSAARVR